MQQVVLPTHDRTVHLVGGVDLQKLSMENSRFQELGALNRPGDPLATTIKRVCEACNNGWMGRIVEEAKPILQRLILGRVERLRWQERIRLVRCLTVTAMMVDQAELRLSAVSQDARRHLMDEKSPPDGWRIYFARNSGAMNSGWWHRSFRAKHNTQRDAPADINVIFGYWEGQHSW